MVMFNISVHDCAISSDGRIITAAADTKGRGIACAWDSASKGISRSLLLTDFDSSFSPEMDTFFCDGQSFLFFSL